MSDQHAPIRLIRGKVARILSSRELALNVGALDGVEVGMRFDVLDPAGGEIRDPDTGQVLGSIPRPKVRVQVESVQDKLSLATTYRSRRVNVGGLGAGLDVGAGLSRMLLPPKWVVQYETLKTDEQTWETLKESESFVKTGDPVVQVIKDEARSEPESATQD